MNIDDEIQSMIDNEIDSHDFIEFGDVENMISEAIGEAIDEAVDEAIEAVGEAIGKAIEATEAVDEAISEAIDRCKHDLRAETPKPPYTLSRYTVEFFAVCGIVSIFKWLL